MSKVTIYPGGSRDIDVPNSQSIALSNYGGGIAQIYYKITGTNYPENFQFQQTLNNGAITLGPFTADTVVRVVANSSKVLYEVGASPTTDIGNATTLNGLTSDQFMRSDQSDFFGSNVNVQYGADNTEGNVRMAHSSGSNGFFITPYASGGYLGGKQISFLASSQEWTIEGSPQIGGGVSGSFTTTDGKTVTVTNGVITNIV